jgi:hypothetical protein
VQLKLNQLYQTQGKQDQNATPYASFDKEVKSSFLRLKTGYKNSPIFLRDEASAKAE